MSVEASSIVYAKEIVLWWEARGKSCTNVERLLAEDLFIYLWQSTLLSCWCSHVRRLRNGAILPFPIQIRAARML